jgi:hypothetical protein
VDELVEKGMAMTSLRSAAACVPFVLAVSACGGGVSSGDGSSEPPSPPGALDRADGGRQVREAGPQPIPGPDGGFLDNGAPSDVYPAPHPAMATIVNAGGTVIHTPRIVTITFPGDAYRATIEDFVRQMGNSKYWAANTTEYGVGPAVAGPPIHVAEMQPSIVDDVAIQRFLRTKLDGTSPEWGTADEETIYALYYPPGVKINLQGYMSCDVFGGYHSETLVGTKTVTYAVIPRCPSFADLHGFDVVTVASSHEFIECANDPRPFTRPSFADSDDDHAIWGLYTGGETGDMCTFNKGAFYTPDDLPFLVQRSWSNVAAAAGHDPCAPALPSEVYFNSAAILDERVILEGKPTKGITIAVGARAVVDLALYSDGPTSGPWNVSAHDLSEDVGGPKVLDFSFDRTRGVNGERLHMTIEVLGVDPQFGGEGFVVESELNGQTTYWYGFVAN